MLRRIHPTTGFVLVWPGPGHGRGGADRQHARLEGCPDRCADIALGGAVHGGRTAVAALDQGSRHDLAGRERGGWGAGATDQLKLHALARLGIAGGGDGQQAEAGIDHLQACAGAADHRAGHDRVALGVDGDGSGRHAVIGRAGEQQQARLDGRADRRAGIGLRDGVGGRRRLVAALDERRGNELAGIRRFRRWA